MGLSEAAGIDARLARWRAFLNPVESSPPRFLFLVRCGQDEPARPLLWPEHRQARVEWAWSLYRHQCDRTGWLADDAVPSLSVATGTEIFAEAFGCRVQRPADNMPFALPLIRSAGEVAGLRVPELSSSSLAYLFEMADELRSRVGPEALLRLVDLQSPMDIAALIWEKSDFLASLLLAPEAVRELAAKVSELLVAFLDEWFHRYGTRYVAHYPDYVMDGGLTLSEDEVGAVSAAAFEGFFAGELATLSTRYGGIGIHCCAHARHQWGHFRQVPGLRLINLHQPHAVLTEAYPFFGPGIVQLHYGFERPGPVESWPSLHPPDRRVIYEVAAAGPEEARSLADRFAALRAEG